jgi:hypothetical protein
MPSALVEQDDDEGEDIFPMMVHEAVVVRPAFTCLTFMDILHSIDPTTAGRHGPLRVRATIHDATSILRVTIIRKANLMVPTFILR